jgi:hypothetical protein
MRDHCLESADSVWRTTDCLRNETRELTVGAPDHDSCNPDRLRERRREGRPVRQIAGMPTRSCDGGVTLARAPPNQASGR